MSENTTQPQGKGLGVAGFVLSLVGLIFTGMVFAFVAASMMTGGGKGLAYFWIVVCLASVVLSVMGMMKLGKTGGKKGLAIAGMIIGIIATVWSVILLMGLSIVESTAMDALNGTEWDELNDALNELENVQ
jgi:hypothetical protein